MKNEGMFRKNSRVVFGPILLKTFSKFQQLTASKRLVF